MNQPALDEVRGVRGNSQRHRQRLLTERSMSDFVCFLVLPDLTG